jgi:hypothetical protein
MRKGNRCLGLIVAGFVRAEMRFCMARSSANVGASFLARTSCSLPRLSNATAVTSPGLPEVNKAAIVSRMRISEWASLPSSLEGPLLVRHLEIGRTKLVQKMQSFGQDCLVQGEHG